MSSKILSIQITDRQDVTYNDIRNKIDRIRDKTGWAGSLRGRISKMIGKSQRK